jgi:hydroxymethylpyrimidine/phosphomethylpyrimidine kinase
MLANESIILELVKVLKSYPQLPPLVVDTVMVSTSGHTLLEEGAIASLKSELLPLATIVTPNLPEGRILAGLPKEGPETISEEQSPPRLRMVFFD